MKPSLGPKKSVEGSMAFTELASTDSHRTMKFLEEAFGWKFDAIKYPMGQYLTYRAPGGNTIGIRPTQVAETAVSVNYVRVDDLRAAEEKIRSLNAEIVLARTDIPKMGSFFWFRIPGGPIMACWQDSPPT